MDMMLSFFQLLDKLGTSSGNMNVLLYTLVALGTSSGNMNVLLYTLVALAQSLFNCMGCLSEAVPMPPPKRSVVQCPSTGKSDFAYIQFQTG